ncbi:MAG: hypothetical protein JNM14_04800 [Ferruginibacter sp.]|nr:hypothetical protein [Ferruginibacter sp.]
MAMQRIALITYLYGEKSNTVSGLRTQSWAKAFAAAGMEVTVFTRDWKEVKDIQASEHIGSAGYTNSREEWIDNIRLIYLPYTKPYEPSSPLLRKIHNTFFALAGYYSGEADITQWYSSIIKEHKKKPFTHFVTSCHPFSSLLLMKRIKKHFSDCITLVDFRDYINVNLLNPAVKFSLLSKLIINVQQKWITRYANKIDLVTTASESISEKFEQVHQCKNVTTIYNGFEANLFDHVEEKTSKLFNVSLIGTLYTNQDIDFMLEGLLDFFKKNSSTDDIMVNFIGVDYYPVVAKQIREKLAAYSNCINITSRIQRGKAIDVMKNSNILFYVGWKGWKGIYSGKIFEYLGAKKNILIAPNDGDVLERLVHYTNSGKLAGTTEEMALILDNWYRLWKKNELGYSGIDERINEFTRESQAKKILKLIKADKILS